MKLVNRGDEYIKMTISKNIDIASLQSYMEFRYYRMNGAKQYKVSISKNELIMRKVPAVDFDRVVSDILDVYCSL